MRGTVAKIRYQAVGFPCNRMLKWSSSRGIRIDVPVLPVSWSFEDHSVIIQAVRKGLIEHEASDTGGVPRWKSSCPDRLAEATTRSIHKYVVERRSIYVSGPINRSTSGFKLSDGNSLPHE